jgi:hypothetical protein
MLRSLSADKLTISSRRDRTDLEVLFMEGTMAALLRFIGSTEVGNKSKDETNRYDLWDVDRLDRRDDEDAMEDGDRRRE